MRLGTPGARMPVRLDACARGCICTPRPSCHGSLSPAVAWPVSGLSAPLNVYPARAPPYRSADSILQLLKDRFRKEIVYTYVGDIVVSVNPFKNVRCTDDFVSFPP